MKYYKASEEYVKFLGRAVYEDDVLRCAHSGTGAEFIFTGTKAEVTILGDSACTEENAMFAARIAILVNDVRVIDTMQKEAETTYTVWESDTVQDIKITILKLSESRMSTMAIKQIGVEAEGDIYPTKDKDFFIEFVGDSITCAYGVDDECIEHIFSTASEDVTKAFSYRTAELLNADYSMVGMSSFGIISGYTADGNTKMSESLVAPYYDKEGISDGELNGKKPQDVTWSFAKREPDLVVINLGTNDDSYCQDYADRQEEFIVNYVEFLKKIRGKNPNAKILCTLGMMGIRQCPTVEKSVERYKAETNDANIDTMMFEDQKPEDGLVVDWHPSKVTHDKAARVLAKKISTLFDIKAYQKDAIPYIIDPNRPIAALTFDDGPNDTITLEVLEKLKKYNVVGSFFLIGQNINETTREVVRKEYDMGCEIHNHSLHHYDMTKLTAEEVKKEIDATTEMIVDITGKEPTFFRPPFILVNDTMRQTIRLPFICGINGEDWVPTVPAEERAQRILDSVCDGALILLHDLVHNTPTVEALDIIIPELLRRGYQLVNVSDVFKKRKAVPQMCIDENYSVAH